MRAAVATLLLALLLPGDALAQPEAPENTAVEIAGKALDLVIVRPLGFTALVAGALLFVPTALITAPTGRHGIQEAWELMVAVPAENVFQRPLGSF